MVQALLKIASVQNMQIVQIELLLIFSKLQLRSIEVFCLSLISKIKRQDYFNLKD